MNAAVLDARRPLNSEKGTNHMAATEDQITDLAQVIANQAEAVATGNVVGPRYSAIKRLQNNVDTLAAWVGDDRT